MFEDSCSANTKIALVIYSMLLLSTFAYLLSMLHFLEFKMVSMIVLFNLGHLTFVRYFVIHMKMLDLFLCSSIAIYVFIRRDMCLTTPQANTDSKQ